MVDIKTQPDDEHNLSEVFGVDFDGMSINKDMTVTLKESDISHSGTMQMKGKAVKTNITANTAKSLGTVKDNKQSYPVIIYNQYGRGKVILFSFDLLNSPNQTKVKDLVINSINFVAPKEYCSRALSDAPVKITLQNSTEPVDIKVSETLLAKTTAEGIAPETTQVDNTIPWSLSLLGNEKKTLGYWLNLPDIAGNYQAGTWRGQAWYCGI